MRMATLRSIFVEIRAVNVQNFSLAAFFRLLWKKAGPSWSNVWKKKQGLVIVGNFNTGELLQTTMLRAVIGSLILRITRLNQLYTFNDLNITYRCGRIKQIFEVQYNNWFSVQKIQVAEFPYRKIENGTLELTFWAEPRQDVLNLIVLID